MWHALFKTVGDPAPCGRILFDSYRCVYTFLASLLGSDTCKGQSVVSSSVEQIRDVNINKRRIRAPKTLPLPWNCTESFSTKSERIQMFVVTKNAFSRMNLRKVFSYNRYSSIKEASGNGSSPSRHFERFVARWATNVCEGLLISLRWRSRCIRCTVLIWSLKRIKPVK